MKFHINPNDPIAQKLHGNENFPLETPSPIDEIWKQMMQDFKAKKEWYDSYQKNFENSESLNAKLATTHPQAKYESINMRHSDDEWAANLVRDLGLNPEVTRKVVITLEMGQPILLESEQYAVANKSIGSVLKADKPEGIKPPF